MSEAAVLLAARGVGSDSSGSEIEWQRSRADERCIGPLANARGFGRTPRGRNVAKALVLGGMAIVAVEALRLRRGLGRRFAPGAVVEEETWACSGMQEDCSVTQCCRLAGQTCFQKDAFWATCLDTCAPGIQKSGAEEGETWSCTALGARTPFPALCAWPGQDCRELNECCHSDYQCVKKDDHWSACMQTTPEGWDGTVVANASRQEYALPRATDEVARTSLFCWMAIMPDSWEVNLTRLARERVSGIFACDEHAVYHSEKATWQRWQTGQKTLVNTEGFVSIWRKVYEDGQYARHDWTIKSDSDCVFFPDRVRLHLRNLQVPAYSPVWIKNTQDLYNGGFLGALEILSKWAVEKFIDNMADCVRYIGVRSGEDGFLRDCLVALGVGRMHDELMMHSTVDPPACQVAEVAAFHPLKTEGLWLGCFDIGVGKEKHPPPLLKGQAMLLPESIRDKYLEVAA